jgi:hypothetical protein
MPITVSPNSDDIFSALLAFLADVLPLPAGTIIQGQQNRVAPPANPDYVVMWPVLLPRIATNIDAYQDAVFTGSIAGQTMTITAVNPNFTGQIAVGSTIFGVGVAINTAVTALGTGTGGVGTYTITPSQTLASETLAAGVETLLQETEVVIQVDVHGPNGHDNTQLISTLFRDEYGVEAFAALNANIAPLYAEEPRQIGFLNDSQQWENKFTIDLHLQANQTVTVPLQFAAAVAVGLIDVDAVYPP